jgi:two-component system CheB/CheR fusion protein
VAVGGGVVHVNDAIISFALDQTILSWNGGAERCSATRREAIGQPLALLVPDSIAATTTPPAMLAEHGRRRRSRTWRRCAAQGRQRWCTWRSRAPIKDADGHVLAAPPSRATSRQPRAAAEALRQSEERLRLIIENAREYAIFSTDLERRVTSWNSGAERLLGYTERRRSSGSRPTSSSPRRTAPPARPRRRRAPRGKEGRASDDRIHVRKDGSSFWAEGILMLMRNAGGEAVGFVKILRDQTEARQAQQALQQARPNWCTARCRRRRPRGARWRGRRRQGPLPGRAVARAAQPAGGGPSSLCTAGRLRA